MLEAVTIERLYKLIMELVSMLELELAEIKADNFKTKTSLKKNLTENLHKLVCLIIQLSKLKSNNINETSNSQEILQDQEIIKEFLKNYSLPNKLK